MSKVMGMFEVNGKKYVVVRHGKNAHVRPLCEHKLYMSKERKYFRKISA